MKRALFVLALSLGLVLRWAKGAEPAAPTFVFEAVTATGAARSRVTLFANHVLVRKNETAEGKIEMKKRKLSEEEFKYYVEFFGSEEARKGEGVFTSGLGGDAIPVTRVELAVPAGARWKLDYDSMSAMTPDASRLKNAIEGLADSFGKILPSESDFTPEKLTPGTVLRRRDGAAFRVVRYDEGAGIVELMGVDEPYSQFYKIARLRLFFLPP